MKTSWKTSLFGLLSATAGVASQTDALGPKARGIAALIAYVSTALIGLFARDNSVTSEQAGAK